MMADDEQDFVIRNAFNIDSNYSYFSQYKQWMREGRMPHHGVCTSLKSFEPRFAITLFPNYRYTKPLCDLFVPQDPLSTTPYWGRLNEDRDLRAFNSFRQTVMLFLAVINGERVCKR